MQVRKITSKEDRVKVVDWIRSGAPLKKGVSLYASLPHDPILLSALSKNPKQNAERLIDDICMLMDITRNKFQQIINNHNGKQNPTNTGNKGAGIKSNTGEHKRAGGQSKTIYQTNRSFRNEWPFLSRPECPPELKALAADKISSWERYTEAHKKLFDCSTLEECYQVAHSIIENFKENRLIYEELEYYKQHGTILGKHRIWNQYKRFEGLRGLNIIELVKLHENTLPHRIWRIESEIKKGDKPHLLGEREKRLNEVKAELAEVKRILGIHG